MMAELPIEVRRMNWGWFGEPWLSGVCYKDDGSLDTEMRKPVPVGEKCFSCEEVITAGDQGKTCGLYFPARHSMPELAHMHKECLVRSVLGSLAHLERRCSCYGGEGSHEPGMSRRQEALAVRAWATTGNTGCNTRGR